MKKIRQKINKFGTFFSRIPIFLLAFTILFFILCDILLVFKIISNKIKQELLLQNPIIDFSPSDYPILSPSAFKNLYVSAKAVVVLDGPSGTILYSKNADLRFAPASTTKIMTALIALSYYRQNDILQVKRAYVEGSKVGLVLGDRLTFRDMLYGMLLPSGNDAADAIADNYKIGEREFVRQMNMKARKLNLYNTHFADPAGLDDDGDYTTALDLAHLAFSAMKNKIFAKAVDTRQAVISNIDGSHVYAIKNLNKLLGIDGVYGIKTGTTEEAEQVLVLCKDYNRHRVIIVIMGSRHRFQDAEAILSVLDRHITYLSIHP
ncbi:D-alanyl-D-alanine carboxypeptidase [Patescibacteria group bacterium]|nr:D-alanyl-D-alanine carboxypeptidase [Patescibacteria group bacterium]MCL5010101.1 D-alanyl-D-alanine carboxypeptidase [Patescibacteria group bacterium]